MQGYFQSPNNDPPEPTNMYTASSLVSSLGIYIIHCSFLFVSRRSTFFLSTELGDECGLSAFHRRQKIGAAGVALFVFFSTNKQTNKQTIHRKPSRQRGIKEE